MQAELLTGWKKPKPRLALKAHGTQIMKNKALVGIPNTSSKQIVKYVWSSGLSFLLVQFAGLQFGVVGLHKFSS